MERLRSLIQRSVHVRGWYCVSSSAHVIYRAGLLINQSIHTRRKNPTEDGEGNESIHRGEELLRMDGSFMETGYRTIWAFNLIST